jgi:hypothetical protein
MRTYSKILILFLIFKISLVFGQTKQDIAIENKSWNIVNYNPSQGPYCIWQTYEIRLVGDTIIGNSEYKIVRQSEFGSQPENWAIVGFIREDSTKKIYFKNYLSEVLLYDFNVNIGDIVDIACPHINPYSMQFEFFKYLQMIVFSIDSVETNEGLKKRIKLNPICTTEFETHWIEGVGDMGGILNSTVGSVFCSGDSLVGIGTGGSVDELLCCKDDSLLLFINSFYNTCYYYSTAGINEPVKNKIDVNVYPNPIVDISTFEISNLQSVLIHLDIFNLSGEKVKSIDTKENIITINRNDFQSGFHIYKIVLENKSSKCGKLIMR